VCLPDGSGFGSCTCSAGSSGGSVGGVGGAGNSGGAAGTTATGGFAGSITIDASTGSGGFAGGVCGALSLLAENRLRPVHVVWALDDSASMADEILAVQDNLNAFADAIRTSGIEVRIVLIGHGACVPAPLGSGVCPNDSRPPEYLRVDVGVGGGDGLRNIIQVYPQYQNWLESSWQPYLGVISDSNSSTMSASEFAAAIASLGAELDGWKFAGVVCTRTCSACSTAATVYPELATQTAGTAGDLCGLRNALSSLASSIVAGAKLACFWDLPPPPTGTQLDPALINVQYVLDGQPPEQVPMVGGASACGSESGWYYDNPTSPTRFYFCPASCRAVESALDASVEVLFGCYNYVRP
jgi:hypothetical protein